jgi:hypothetical protein
MVKVTFEYDESTRTCEILVSGCFNPTEVKEVCKAVLMNLKCGSIVRPVSQEGDGTVTYLLTPRISYGLLRR